MRSLIFCLVYSHVLLVYWISFLDRSTLTQIAATTIDSGGSSTTIK